MQQLFSPNDRPEERNQRHCREQRDESTSNAVHDISSIASTTKEADSSTSSSKGRAREAQPVSKSSMQQNSNVRPEERNQRHCRKQCDEPTSNAVHDISSIASTTKEADSSTSSSKGRAREVIEVMPIQNQAAAQKLLQKMVQPRQGKWPPRGQRHRVNVDDNPVFTLEEWENRKVGSSKQAPAGEMVDVSRDEEIARQLQMQLDLEDFHVQEGNGNKVEAERIKMSMFNFQHGEERCDGRRESRGRGRGRGWRRFV